MKASVDSEDDDAVVIRIEVQDTGIGIPSDRLDRLFQVFSQVDASNTREFGGTGLGLAISRQLAVAMGGDAGVESVEGKGSTFWFSCRLEKQVDGKPRELKVPIDFSDLHVLVVDDNATNRKILRHHLEAWGCWPTCVPSGQEALEIMRSAAVTPRAFGLVLIDMQMPGMDGEELALRIREDAYLRGTPVIMLTSIYQKRDVRRFAEIGISGYLNKPVKMSQLFDCMALVLDEKRSRDELGDGDDDAACIPTRTVTAEALDSMQREGAVRILVVDDNEVNQKVASQMLRRLGFGCEIATNGQQAVDAIQRTPFDIVFMDCQMPVMDGFEATARVRDLERELGRHTVIVAMTANAMKGDPERCRAAGMDDYISKPVRPHKLEQLLDRWLANDDLEIAKH
jgi:CheY-like chemotaxis protein